MASLIPTAAEALAYEQAVAVSNEEANQSILKSLQLELDKHRMREVLDIFNNNVLTEVHKHGSFIVWDLVPIICQRLRGLNEFRFKTFNCCRQMLIDLVEVCNPKELLIIYLSELENDLTLAKHSSAGNGGSADQAAAVEESATETSATGGGGDAASDKFSPEDDFEVTDSNCFKALLKPFECILLKLPKKRNETLKSVLSSLNEHISRLSLGVIETYDFELHDRHRLMAEPEVRNLNCVLSMYVDFLETFVNEVDITQGDANYFYSKTSVPNIQRCILLKTLLRILDYPLKYMDLSQLTTKAAADGASTAAAAAAGHHLTTAVAAIANNRAAAEAALRAAKPAAPKQQQQSPAKKQLNGVQNTTNTNTNNSTSRSSRGSTSSSSTTSTSTSTSTSSTSTTSTTNGLIMPSILDDECIHSRTIALKVVRLISVLHSNFYTLLNRQDLVTAEEAIEEGAAGGGGGGDSFSDIFLTADIFRSAMAVLCYLLATEEVLQLETNFMPRVYTHVYSLGVHLPYVRHLLDSSQFLVYDKGVELLERLLAPFDEGQLEVKFLDLLRAMPIEKSLISIMIFSPSKSRRSAALKLFQRLLWSLEHIARYKVLYSILSQPRQHAGFQGLAIGLYKDYMFESAVYQGTNLHRVVRSVIGICLPEEVSSDLLEKNDLIFAALNFFRYVAIRDPRPVNATRLWDILVVIRESFLAPLQKAVELSRAHYKLELVKLKELKEITAKATAAVAATGGGGGAGGGGGKNRNNKALQTVLKQMAEKSLQASSLQAKLAVKVLNEGGGKGKGSTVPSQAQLPEMSIEQEHSVIILALQNFDLLESLLARLKELVEQSAAGGGGNSSANNNNNNSTTSVTNAGGQ